ncbi:phosphatase PAP2 family protein [Bacillus shivajii]|uniref:phosphatase PAP2 family protein n=1 Tax=Bacillus shivajii TaxID=1983719 RepID=UPI001CFB27C2|nr:phosphatase PAP2 family protein [Bacillus shivajii]UCZ54217.1 phosphatase PAP2 family protein [Bacillus shivajii]
MKNKQLTLLIIISFIVFAGLSVASTFSNGLVFDNALITWLLSISSPIVVDVMNVVSPIGSGETILILMVIIASILIFLKKYYYSILVVVITVGGVALNFVLKILFQRERPGEMSYIEVFGYSVELASYSFPSGHTMRTVLLFTFIIYISYLFIHNTALRVLAYIVCTVIIAGVALSRIITGAHFPSDIFAAISISIVWFGLVVMYLPKLLAKNRYTKKLI